MTEVLAEKSLAHLVDDMIQVRFELDGSTDRGWKDAYNALAAEAQLTAEATDYEGLSVVIIRLPVHVNQAEFNGILNRAEKLVHDADKERHKTSYPEAHADALMVRWQEDREEERLRRAER
jgi:hypothetical protein